MRLLRVLVALSLFFAVNASAQTTTGSMSGSVVDSTGQVLPGATVTIVHERTGEQRVGTTNEVGLFSFPALMPGPYTVRAELTGFRQIEVKNKVVLANQRLTVEPLTPSTVALPACRLRAVWKAVITRKSLVMSW